MRVEEGKIVYELTTCFSCNGTGKYRPNHPCPRHDRPQKGQPCPHCGSKTKYHHYLPDEQDSTCPKCQGTGKEMEDRCDFMPREIVQAIPIVVVPSERMITWNESFLGRGCLWSTMDYGEHKRLSLEDLVAKVRGNMHTVQAISVVDEQGRMPPFLAICCNNQGYSVRSAWKLPQILREFDVETGRIVGMQVFRAGGHGTMAAALGKPIAEERR